MFLNQLAEHHDLPVCFNAWCDCGWAGRRALGGVFLVGGWIYDPSSGGSYEDPTPKCPKCKKDLHSGLDKESIESRFKWTSERPLQLYGRGEIIFPCTCKSNPPMRLSGKIVIRLSPQSEAFISDMVWIRIAANVKCCGCFAEGCLGLLERHHSQDITDDVYRTMIS